MQVIFWLSNNKVWVAGMFIQNISYLIFTQIKEKSAYYLAYSTI